MNELIRINKNFLIKSYFWISGILSFVFLLYLCFFLRETTLKWIITILIMIIMVCPLSIIGVWAYDWKRKRKYLKKILKQNPFSELEKIGFLKKTLISNHNSLKDYVRFAEINNVQIILNVDITKPNVAEFTTYCNTFNLTNQQFSQKSEELKHKNIELGFYTLTKKIDIHKEKMSIQNLEKILFDLTQIVRMNKFEQIQITEWEEI